MAFTFIIVYHFIDMNNTVGPPNLLEEKSRLGITKLICSLYFKLLNVKNKIYKIFLLLRCVF